MFEPFSVRSFRFQWPADLMASWAFEMETIILGWYVLTITDSVLVLTIFASMQWLGTLIAPYLGVLGDRWGRRTMLCLLRGSYLTTSIITMSLALTDTLNASIILGISFLIGLVRPSDLVMRNGLIGDTMLANVLMKAMGVSRTTMDSARIAGALVGAGLFSSLGIGYAYVAVTIFYVISLLLTCGVSSVKTRTCRENDTINRSPLMDLKDGLDYVWGTPTLLAAMWFAFLVNLTVFPVSHGILPFVAKEIYNIDENDVRRTRDGLYFELLEDIEDISVQMIFLDTRFFRDALLPTDEKGAPGKERYLPHTDTSLTMLGDAQWNWLEQKMQTEVDHRIIVTSIQFLAMGHGWEAWKTLPHERQRLIDLIDQSSLDEVLFISGDRHRGGLYQFSTQSGKVISEMTSSSLNLAFANDEEDGPLRLGPTFVQENYGEILLDKLTNKLTVNLKDNQGKIIQSLSL